MCVKHLARLDSLQCRPEYSLPSYVVVRTPPPSVTTTNTVSTAVSSCPSGAVVVYVWGISVVMIGGGAAWLDGAWSVASGDDGDGDEERVDADADGESNGAVEDDARLDDAEGEGGSDVIDAEGGVGMELTDGEAVCVGMTADDMLADEEAAAVELDGLCPLVDGVAAGSSEDAGADSAVAA